MSKSLSSKLYLKKRLYGLKMVEGSDLVKHVNIFNQIIGDLARVDVKLGDEDKAIILLCSLPSSYENLVMTLTCGKDEISLDTVSAALLSQAERRQHTSDNSQSEGLYVRGNQDRGRTKEKQEGSNKQSRSKSKGKKPVTCYFCKEEGHFKRDCPARKKKYEDKKSEESSKSANVVQKDDSDGADSDMLSVTSRNYSDVWIMDTGCSFHMTPNRDWFETYKSRALAVSD